MPDRHDRRLVRRVVELLVADSPVSLGAVLYTKTKSVEVRAVREQAAWLLHHDGGWTYSDIAVVFFAWDDRSAVWRAVDRAEEPSDEIREAAHQHLRWQPCNR